MNAGSGPERDDFGLPPVDIEIPDDARELDADVQAYHRELRALRRRQRSDRLRRPLSRRQRRGTVLPLLACSLLLALITSTLLVMLTAGQTGMPGSPSQPAAAGGQLAAQKQPRQVGQPLPYTRVIIDGGIMPLLKMTDGNPSVLALIPARCDCAAPLRQLAGAATAAHVRLYLVGAPGQLQQVSQLAAETGQSPGQVADDIYGILAAAYRARGLTAVLVQAAGKVAYIGRDLPAAAQGQGQLRAQLRQLGVASTSR